MAVQVQSVSAATYVLPTDQPEADGTLAWDKTTMVLVQVSADDQTGLGYTYATGACKTLIDELLGPVVTGRDPLDVPGAFEAMVRSARNLGRPGVVSCAISALEISLWDLKARLLGLPLCRLLGQARPDVPIYGSGGFTTYDEETLRAQLEHWVGDLAIPRVKIKIGESWGRNARRDLERIDFARKVIGAEPELFVDANGGYTVGQAVRVAEAMAESAVSWLEEPVSSDDLYGLALIRQEVIPDVAAGEYGYDLSYFARMIEAGSVDCLQIDVTRCGGIIEWTRAAGVAASHNLQVSCHCAPSLHAHVAAVVPNLRHVEYFHDHVRMESMFFDGTLDPRGGVLRPDQGRPGLGLGLKDTASEQFRVA